MGPKIQYGKWSVDELHLAVAAYLNGDYGLNECARIYNVPKPTIKRHAENKNKNANMDIKSFGRSKVFSSAIESELDQHILKFEEMMFGLTLSDVRKLAFEVAERNGLPHNFNVEKRMAGKKWFYAFMKRHPKLSYRQPEATSMARAKGFNKQKVYEFFYLLETLCDKRSITATRIFNVDETGFSTVQKKTQKIVARKGKKQVGVISSGERGVNTTMVCCASASGQYVPPMIIFKMQRMAKELRAGAPPGSIVDISETGYINSELFVKWLEHFIATVHPSKERPVLLLLDGHTTHSRNLEALMLARENGVMLLQLPGHTTHRLQPLDMSFFSPLEVYYTQAMEKWLRSNPGSTISLFQVSQLLGEAYGRAASVSTAEGGFRSSGVWPVNRHVFADHQFVAAEVLNQNNLETENEAALRVVDIPEVPSVTCPNEDEDRSDAINDEGNASRPLKVPLQEISPIPKVKARVASTRALRPGQGACELTSSPYKEKLRLAKEGKAKPAKLPAKRKCFGDTAVKPTKKPRDGAAVEWYCELCEEDKMEEMIRCMKCKIWIHAKCAGVGKGVKKFFCNVCK